jgi:hypothetical protein
MVTTGARLMPKFTFIGEHTNLYGKPDGTKVTYEFQVDSMNDILEHVDLFIRGCGYMPPPGTLDYVVDDYSDHGGGSTMEDYPELYEAQDLPTGKSHHYFDTERNK